MSRYVLVEADGFNKNITGGPFDVDDPSQITVPEGQRLMSEDEALAEGYHYSEGGAGFMADRSADAATAEDDEGDDSQAQPDGQDQQ